MSVVIAGGLANSSSLSREGRRGYRLQSFLIVSAWLILRYVQKKFRQAMVRSGNGDG
jgi:hypothetical protein